MKHVLAAFLAARAVVAAVEPSPTLEVVRRVELGASLRHTQDVRFDQKDRLLLAVGELGAAFVSFDGKLVGEPEISVPEGAKGIVIASHVGLSTQYVVVSSSLSQLVWVDRRPQGGRGSLGTWGSQENTPISFFEDVDLHEDRLAILGLMRSDTGMSPDGAVAWVGRIERGSVDLQPIHYSAAGKGARPFDACSVFAAGKVRFLEDGRLLVVPGAEPGVFLYSAEGKLERTWDTVSLGLDLRCDFDDETLLLYNSDVPARLEYIARFLTVDEALPTRPDPSLLLRRVEGEETSWQMVLLHEDGTTTKIQVPITAKSRKAHLWGDAQGDRILLVLREFLPTPGEEWAELVELRLERGDDPTPTPEPPESHR